MNLIAANLMSKEYGERGCYLFAREALARLGAELPEDPAECLANVDAIGRGLGAGEACRLGDCILIDQQLDGTTVQHVGIALDAFKFASAMKAGRPRVDRIAAWRKLGVGMRVVRLHALEVAR